MRRRSPTRESSPGPSGRPRPAHRRRGSGSRDKYCETRHRDRARGNPRATADHRRPLETIEEQFWTSRPSLTLIYDAALSQMCSPWAVLACCAARTLALVPPHVTLPAIIGGEGSLNWFAALVAKSGGGKGAANAVATKLVPGDIITRGAGSGEGMIEAYNRSAEPQDHIGSILFSRRRGRLTDITEGPIRADHHERHPLGILRRNAGILLPGPVQGEGRRPHLPHDDDRRRATRAGRRTVRRRRWWHPPAVHVVPGPRPSHSGRATAVAHRRRRGAVGAAGNRHAGRSRSVAYRSRPRPRRSSSRPARSR